MAGKTIGAKNQADALGTLREILELAKNPQSIVDAEKLARKESALTDAEQAEADNARAYIKQHAQLMADLKKQQDAFDSEKAKHEETVSQFAIDTSKTKDELAKREEAVVKKEKQIEDSQTQLVQSQTSLAKIHNDALRDAKNQASANAKFKADLDTRESDLNDRDAKIKERERKLAIKAAALASATAAVQAD